VSGHGGWLDTQALPEARQCVFDTKIEGWVKKVSCREIWAVF